MEDTPQRKQQTRRFIERWKAAEGNEESQDQSFLNEFLQDVLGIQNPTKVLDYQRHVKGRKIDAFYEDMGILIEVKSRKPGILDKPRDNGKYGFETPYQQAKWYRDNMPASIAPRWIIVTDFDEFRIHDLNMENPDTDYTSVKLEDLESHSYLFNFFFDKSQSRLVKERKLSIEAGKIVGTLYDAFAKQYMNLADSKEEQRSLNVLIVRLVFLLYAEDAGLLQEHQAFCKYMKKFEPEQCRRALIELFDVLDTPEDERDPYTREDLLAFPYINGSLFGKDDIIIPQFTPQLKYDLLLNASQEFDWSDISPTIFGAVFESTLNPETRRAGGMHYTSIENIHKVIDPLFLDDLKAELAEIEGEKVEKTRRMGLRAFQRKLGSLRIFDPACGSGNFLTESYIQLRRLENRVLESIQGDQVAMGFGDENDPVKVSIKQFYGIEINDFAVSVAKTALWIAESQMLDETQDLLMQPLDFFPLTTNATIVQGNALRMDWNDVLPSSECSYIIGNPPFIGYSNLDAKQKEDRFNVLGDGSGLLDYVACWYRKAVDYMQGTAIHAALVSTNSICQGQQVEILWKTLFEDGMHIDFAYQTFVWNSEAISIAHVHVIIVGFSCTDDRRARILYTGDGAQEVAHINAYLQDADDVFITRRSRPISDVPEMSAGGKPTDGGNLIFTEEELSKFLSNNPKAEKWIRPFSMGADFIDGKPRYCLWLVDVPASEWGSVPGVVDRVKAVERMRLGSSKIATRKKAEVPWRFDEVKEYGDVYIAIPAVSSERRDYVPMGFVTNGMIPGNQLYCVSNAGLYEFGVMMSQFHNAWMRVVAGRLKSDYRYTNTIVYNNFVWPNPTDEQKAAVEQAAQAVLDAREAHPGATLADLYDPDKMPADLLAAHKTLDAAVEAAYGVDFQGDEEKIVSHLFELYTEAAVS